MTIASDIFENYKSSLFCCTAKNKLFQERKTEWLTLAILHTYASECVFQIYKHIPWEIDVNNHKVSKVTMYPLFLYDLNYFFNGYKKLLSNGRCRPCILHIMIMDLKECSFKQLNICMYHLVWIQIKEN
jgi:hypothetical protein